MENIFIKIVKGEIPCAKIYEDEKFLAFLDINPVSRGHTLLIPKEEYKQMTDMPNELLGEIFVIAKKLMIKIKESMKCDFVQLSVVGIDIPHFHIHLIPRYFNDGLKGWPTFEYKEGEMEDIARKIRV